MSTTTVRNQGQQSAQKIVPRYIAHLVLRTRRVRELVDWYIRVFQAQTVFDNGSLAFLYFDNEHHRIAIGEPPGGLEPPNPRAAGIDHVAFSYASLPELLATYKRLKSEGILPYFKIDHGPTTSIYYKDPDGNQVELQVDNFDSREEAHRYFKSSAFAVNPLGVEIDPDELLARLEAGTDPRALLSFGTRDKL